MHTIDIYFRNKRVYRYRDVIKLNLALIEFLITNAFA